MNIAEYENKIALYTTKIDIANLTYSILKAVTKKELSVSEAKPLIEKILEKGLDLDAREDYDPSEWTCLEPLQYANDEELLDLARMIFEKCTIPQRLYVDTLVYLHRIDSIVYQVKFFLLMHAYMWEPDKPVVKMKDTLLENMFTEGFHYNSPKNKKLELTPSIFKEIEKYDISIEVYRLGRHCCEIIYHIFDKETRLEVATYADIGG